MSGQENPRVRKGRTPAYMMLGKVLTVILVPHSITVEPTLTQDAAGHFKHSNPRTIWKHRMSLVRVECFNMCIITYYSQQIPLKLVHSLFIWLCCWTTWHRGRPNSVFRANILYLLHLARTNCSLAQHFLNNQSVPSESPRRWKDKRPTSSKYYFI